MSNTHKGQYLNLYYVRRLSAAEEQMSSLREENAKLRLVSNVHSATAISSTVSLINKSLISSIVTH